MKTDLQKLSLGSLATLDGGSVNDQFDSALKRASLDLQSRPGETKARTVGLKITLVPVVDQNGFCEDAKWVVAVEDKIPSYKSPDFSAGLRRDGSFVFNEDSLTDVDQGTLKYGDPDMDDDYDS
jgi:hypothetical protein